MNINTVIIPLLLTATAGLSTVIGGIIVLFFKVNNKKNMGFFLGLSAGVMLFLSFMELMPNAIKDVGNIPAYISFFIGIFIIGAIDFLLPHHYIQEKACANSHQPKLFSTGIMVTLGIAIHNFPEGIAVFLSSYTDIKLGILLAFSIMIHNIPEGIAVAAPIYAATRSKRKVFQSVFFSGIAEPIGAIVAFFILRPYITSHLLSHLFAVIAGIMVFISFDELLPACYKETEGHNTIVGVIVGMLIISASIILL